MDSQVPKGRFSWLLGLLDQACGVSFYFKKILHPSFRHWTEGWGELDQMEGLYVDAKEANQRHAQGPEAYAPTVEVQDWPDNAHRRCAGGRVFVGSLPSPLGTHLPPECATVPFEAVFPDREPWAIVVLCCGTADETFIYRRKVLAEPLVAHGVACLIPMMPFYGPRRRTGQHLFYLKSFSDLITQCVAGCSENIALLDWARVQYPNALLGVAGMSHGAGATVATACYAHHDLAVIPLLIPTSPAVLATGSLQNELAFDALGPIDEDVRSVIVDTLEKEVSPFAKDAQLRSTLGEPPHTFTRCVTAAAAANDGFVLPEWSKLAYSLVQENLDPRAELKWVPGGHCSSFLGARWLFIDIILQGLRRLEKTREQAACPSRL
jgi:hypothetical protein